MAPVAGQLRNPPNMPSSCEFICHCLKVCFRLHTHNHFTYLCMQSQSADSPNSSKMVRRDFPFAPIKYVQTLLSKNDQLLLPTYLELEETIHNWDKLSEKPWTKNFDSTKLRSIGQREEAELERATQKTNLPKPYREELEEMMAARAVRSFRNQFRARQQDNHPQQQQPVDEKEISEPAGEVIECQCCFDEQPLANMVHCDGDEAHVSAQLSNPSDPD